MTLHSDGSASVEDNGRGIPTDIHPKEKVSGVQLVFTKLHAGGKFGQGNYEYSGGLHGVGASVTNALSEWLTVEICRNKRIYKMSFHSKYNARKKKIESGLPDGPLDDTGIRTNRQGTLVRFKPDANVFSETEFDLDTVEERLKQLAFLNRGVEITLIDERITMAEAKRSRMLFGSDDETENEDGENVTENAENTESVEMEGNEQLDMFGGDFGQSSLVSCLLTSQNPSILLPITVFAPNVARPLNTTICVTTILATQNVPIVLLSLKTQTILLPILIITIAA